MIVREAGPGDQACVGSEAMSANPPRWHADPTGRHELRYWDGRAWTSHVSDRGVASTDPLPAARPARSTTEATLTPSSEGRSTPADHRPLSAGPTNPGDVPTPAARPVAAGGERPTPIVTRAGWSKRTKLLVAFIALDAVVAAVLIVLLAR